MPKVKQSISKIGHPNSRKTAAVAKQIKKKHDRQKTKLTHLYLQNLIAEKLMWFKDRLLHDVNVYSAEQTDDIIIQYLSRFNEELEQINIKHSIGKRKNRQHASREDTIKLTINKEIEEYNTCGIEMPDLMNEKQLTLLRTWSGELKYLQKFQLRRISKKFLQGRKHQKLNLLY